MILSLRASLAVAAALVIGCSGTPPQPQPQLTAGVGPTASTSSSGTVAIAPTPACNLISKYDATAALGVSIDTAHSSEEMTDTASSFSDCLYRHDPSGQVVPLRLSLAIGDVFLAEFEDMSLEQGAVALPNLGDEALLRTNDIWGLDGPVDAAFVRTGNAVIGLTLGIAGIGDDGGLLLVGDGERQREVLIDLAQMALQRLTEPAPPSEPAAKTCQLITLEQAGGILGLSLTSLADVDNHDAWGAECQYNVGNDGELFVAVNSGTTASENFDTCKTGSETVLGVGEEAFYTQPGLCLIQGGGVGVTPLLARSGGTIIAVAEGGRLEFEQSRVALVQLARLALQQLGLDPGSTPAPVAPDALAHPCSLASEQEVGAVLGVAIAMAYERGAVDGQEATCFYSLADSDLYPLNVRLGTGPSSVSEFSNDKAFEGFLPVDGIGDEALQSQVQIDSDQPLVTLHVRTGETLLELSLGGNGNSTGTFRVIAPGTPDEQLVMLRELAQLMLPRLYTPNVTPSPSPNLGASLSLHIEVRYPGGGFEADGTCALGPDDSWLRLGFQRGSQPEEYLTVGPAPDGVGGSSPKGGGVFHADSVKIAVYDAASGALVLAENALAVLPADLRSGTFNGVWKGYSIDLIYTCQ